MVSELAWSPDGSALAFTSGRTGRDIYLRDSHDYTRQLTSSPDQIDDWPRWSPDGNFIAFSRETSQGLQDETASGGRLAIISADGSGLRVVGQGPMVWPASWSGDGERIAYGTGGKIAVFNLATSITTWYGPGELGLPDADYVDAPAWSSVSDQLAVYFSNSSAQLEQTSQGYALIDLNTRQARVVMQYDAPFLLAPPAAWSPDGARVLISLLSPARAPRPEGLWLVDAWTGALHQVRDVVAYQAVWSPSGKTIAYIDNNRRAANILDAITLKSSHQPSLQEPVSEIAWRPGS